MVFRIHPELKLEPKNLNLLQQISRLTGVRILWQNHIGHELSLPVIKALLAGYDETEPIAYNLISESLLYLDKLEDTLSAEVRSYKEKLNKKGQPHGVVLGNRKIAENLRQEQEEWFASIITYQWGHNLKTPVPAGYAKWALEKAMIQFYKLAYKKTSNITESMHPFLKLAYCGTPKSYLKANTIVPI